MRPEADPYADLPDRTTMSDESGVATLVFSATESIQQPTPWADCVWVPGSVPVARAVGLALDAMPGWIFSTTDEALATALLAAGASERRHAHSMTHPLTDAAREQPAGLRIEPLSEVQVDRHAGRLGELNFRAYPACHPDAFDADLPAAVERFRAIARGELLGPMLAESRVALAAGAIVGACIVVDRPGGPPYGGPWVADVFRDQDHPARGVGTALLTASLVAAAEAHRPGLSLVVSHANDRARRLYEHLGFIDVEESWTLVLPKKAERPA